jgi:DNA-binding XRE family transcriptional regulator
METIKTLDESANRPHNCQHAMKTNPRRPRKRKSIKRKPPSPKGDHKEVPFPSLAYNLKMARTKANLSQLALAQAIGLNGDNAGAVICRWENGIYAPTLENLQRIAEALGCTVCSLIG